MVRVLVTGASGYIGQEVAVALRRLGHQVVGLVRSAEKGAHLISNEVDFLVADLAKPETYRDAARDAHVIIHTAADYTNFDVVDNAAVDTFLAPIARAKTKVVIYTSGVLVYPNDNKNVKEEDDAVDPGFLLPARLKNEQRVLASKDVTGVVVRPGFVFGKKSGHFYSYFEKAAAGDLTVAGPNIIYPLIHIDDLVEGYVRIVEAAPAVVDGQIFNFNDDSRFTLLQIATRFAEVAGYKGEIKTSDSATLGFLNKSVLTNYRKAKRILGWFPRHLPIVDEAPLFFRRWKTLNQK